MAELDSSQILVTLSANLPSYSCVKWCRFTHEEQTKRHNPIGFNKKQRLLMILYSLLMLSRENGTKLLTQMSQSGEVKPAQASLSFRL